MVCCPFSALLLITGIVAASDAVYAEAVAQLAAQSAQQAGTGFLTALTPGIGDLDPRAAERNSKVVATV